MEFVNSFLKGKYGLFFTYWMITIPIIVVLRFIYFLINPLAGSILEIVLTFLILASGFIFCIAIWNSASNYRGLNFWKYLAKLFCIVAISLGTINFFTLIKNNSSINFNNNIIVDFYNRTDENNCNSSYTTHPTTIEFVFDEKSNGIFQKSVNSEHDNQFLHKLKNCEIIDSRNWSCGGESLSEGGMTSKYQVINGRFNYINYILPRGITTCDIKWVVR